MSQESENGFEVTIRKMLQDEMKGWQKEQIDEKFHFIMLSYELDMEILASQEKSQKIDEEIAENSLEIQVSSQNTKFLGILFFSRLNLNYPCYISQDMQEEILEIQQKMKGQNEIQLKTIEFRK